MKEGSDYVLFEKLNNTYSNISETTLDEMERYCIARFTKTKFIHPYSTLTIRDINRLIDIKNKTSLVMVMDSIESASTSVTKYFKVEQTCSICNKNEFEYLSKSKLSDLINEKQHSYICESCIKIKKEREQKENEENQKNAEQIRLNNTESFLENYLNPLKSWNEKVKPYEKINEMKYAANKANQDLIFKLINSASYEYFLKTPYWKCIAEYKRYKANMKCELCNSKGLLHVHHKTYKNHGNELFHLDDLIVLCKECHEKFHDKMEVC